MNPPFFTLGMTATQALLSSRSCGMLFSEMPVSSFSTMAEWTTRSCTSLAATETDALNRANRTGNTRFFIAPPEWPTHIGYRESEYHTHGPRRSFRAGAGDQDAAPQLRCERDLKEKNSETFSRSSCGKVLSR